MPVTVKVTTAFGTAILLPSSTVAVTQLCTPGVAFKDVGFTVSVEGATTMVALAESPARLAVKISVHAKHVL